MCGIAGAWSYDGAPASAADVTTMCDAILHRGPDDCGVHVDGSVAIGMRRLSIIDVASGHQPIHNEDGSVWVVFNGEIYNYRELRRDLELRGHRFYTSSDTETIVHLYEAHGEDFVDHLRGMFAIALWDRKAQRLLLARDRLGIKPLFYAQLARRFVFASEVKALLALTDVPRDLDWSAVGHAFTFLATPPDQSVLAGVKKLDAAHVATVSPGGRVSLRRYWDVTFAERDRATEGELVEELRGLLDESVALHMRSDVPVGAFLSGGVDSSAVVAHMRRHAGGELHTFSIGFEDAAFDELKYAREVARRFDTTHHELVVTPQPLDVVEDVCWHLDEPFGDSSAIPTYLVSQLASRTLKVVLTGDGGDELFGGYDKYVVEAREQRLERIPGFLRRIAGAVGRRLPPGARGRRFLTHIALEGPRRYLDASTLFRRDEQQELFDECVRTAIAKTDPASAALDTLNRDHRDWLSALQYCDLRGYLSLDILVKVDRMTMAHSIEARPPLLDHRIVEFAATVPWQLYLRDGATKYLFKRAMSGVVPDAVINRSKQGFGVPLAGWFRGAWTGFVRDLLLSTRSRERGIIAPAMVERLLALHARGRNVDRELWMLVMFEQWCRLFLDATPAARSTASVAVEQFA